MTLTQLLIGLSFLLLASAVVALPFSIFIKQKSLAVVISVGVSTLILKTWAYFEMGGFDVWFLLILMAMSLTAAISVKTAADSIRKTV